jgi:serine/threonine protein kinase
LVLPPVIDEFTEAWERGEAPAVEGYLNRLDPADSDGAVELIYREYCLAEAYGRDPAPSSYVARFPRHREALEQLLRLHGACTPSMLGRWLEPTLPETGDSIGPYRLRRELGRGSFARVFLAEQADLENRLVVVKVSTQATREPWLLARARHAHIVEIVSHALVDDGAFQLICMPFWGGATLAAVLAARRQRVRVPATGRDLLADLDSVAAPEYPAVHPARPAREILAGLSDGQAIAWIVARLAEALSHAFSRDVAHGDVKPSNILLSADGSPMLLDFNLARDSAPAGDGWSQPKDPGGTLVYMAPERLRDLAVVEPAGDRVHLSEIRLDRGGSSRAGPSPSGCGDPALGRLAPHLADVYSLGMVLLEALTGRPPAMLPGLHAPDPRSRLAGLRSAARAYAAARDRGARALIRDFESAGRRSIAPALRAILERCLDPDPSRRYGCALELAEDLDRWRTHRPLAVADEPLWGLTVPRWLRRHRRMLAAAALSMTVGLVTTLVVWRESAQTLHLTLRGLALKKLARHWDSAEARTYRYQRPQTPRFLPPDDPQTVETALRALKEYEVLDPTDWRRRDDVRLLPAADREDLELWIMEQVYRYCRALDDRPESPGDWRRALDVLDRVTASTALPVFDPLRRRLLAKLGTAGVPPALSGSSARPAPVWLDRYLLGVVAECEPESPVGPANAGPPAELGSTDLAAILDAQAGARRRGAEQALRHYDELLEIRPDSFWGHYRAAVASYALDRQSDLKHPRIAAAAVHLEQCLKRRPDNAVLRGQFSGCLETLQHYSEALQNCDQALNGAPDQAEFYRTRAFIRAKLGQTSGLHEDIQHFEVLSRILPRAFWGNTGSGTTDIPGPASHRVWAFPDPLEIETRLSGGSAERDGKIEIGEVPPEELDFRTVLASEVYNAGERELAAAELTKALLIDPDHLAARFRRAIQAVEAQRYDEAERDLEVVLYHPDLFEYLSQNPSRIRWFHTMTCRYLDSGRVEEARRIARRALDLAISLRILRGESHFYLARACAVDGRSNPESIAEAAKQLHNAFVAHPFYKDRNYLRDPTFDPVRVQIDAALQRMPDPVELRRRLAASPVEPQR